MQTDTQATMNGLTGNKSSYANTDGHYMNSIACTIKAILVSSVFVTMAAVAQESKWILNSQPDGSVYRTEVYGISSRDRTTKRARTAISLLCATGTQPKIFLQWENMQGYGNIKINYSIDNTSTTPNGTNFPMIQERDILYRNISESRELLQSMKIGRTLTIDWVGHDQTRYLTIFNLSTFRGNLNEFNKQCNTDI